jgi:cytochrome o ubiquinol oxidase operon protein cyoD
MNHRAEYRRELGSYLVGLGLAVALSAIAFGAVVWNGFDRMTLLWIIAATALIQIVVHLRFFLHIELTRSKRDDLQLILFSALLIGLMVSGTLWILGNLRERMM